MASIDIGMYDSCANGCRYCYANHSPGVVRRNIQSHDPKSSLLYGCIGPEDVVREQSVESCNIRQLNLFDKENFK